MKIQDSDGYFDVDKKPWSKVSLGAPTGLREQISVVREPYRAFSLEKLNTAFHRIGSWYLR